MDDILLAMARPRPSLSPSRFSNDDFRRFRRADTHAFGEREVTRNVIPVIEGTVLDTKCIAGDIAFTNLDDLTDGTIVAAIPDLYYGARPEQLNRQVRKEQSGKIIPSSQSDLPILANFFLEVEGPDGNLSVAFRQACYNGALGARGMHSLQSYCQPELEYDNKAYTISSTYHGGQLKMFASHPIPPRTPGEKPGFAMTQIKAWGLTGDADTFRQGAAAFRNARDWAKEHRDYAIRQANQLAARNHLVPSTAGGLALGVDDDASGEDTLATSQETVLNLGSHATRSSYCSDTSADELSTELGDWLPPKRTKSRSRSRRKNQ
ncbi:uncharacterized protein MAM_06659 [Metarhizium album ARSEF 1941]|uniref:Uncharacterized protein n=1 Tax=Metarhizium album (strain ARSEF 1941) TaxID=1081103 RepID=A0A0B2WPI3_METAS|nr:uncharacterized protein MAM_06659 [Metarhizium album ARSEF 1941]KHN95382.1 hypothetical protein MAM_06659 [Metarhizium album ARSEF 1941]